MNHLPFDISTFKKFFIDTQFREQIELFKSVVSEEASKLPYQLNINNINIPCKTILSKDVLNDVEFFIDYKGDSCNTVFSKLSNLCHTEGAKYCLNRILESPTYDINLIKNRQKIIHRVYNNLQSKHLQSLKALKDTEKDVFWLFEAPNENLRDLYDMVYFRFFLLKPCNFNSYALTGINVYKMFMSPAIGILSPIIYFIVPYMIMTWKFGIKIPFSTYMKFMFSSIIQGDLMSVIMGGGSLGIGAKTIKWISFLFSMIFYFQGMFNSIEVSRTIYKISKFLVTKANKIIEALKAANDIIQELWNDDIKIAFNLDMNDLTQEENDYIRNTLITNHQPFYVYNNFGTSLSFLKTINFNALTKFIKKAYVLDAIVSSVLMLKNHPNMMCFAQMIQQDYPLIDLKNTWHICLDPSNVVCNDIFLQETNMIITGPNAGGKSTFIKTMVINTLLNQTIGICASTQAIVTPFDIIHTQINIPDCKGKESLFEAEMYRCKETLNLISKHGKKLIVMDEIFNSTNPVEGISGAYAVAKNIASNSSVLLAFTTHYTYLTKLAKTNKFTNYRMNVVTNNNTITFPYKLEKGISRQYVALELLKNNGFDEDIIDDAISIKQKLTKSSV